MALGETIKPATDMFAGSFSNIASKAWILIPVVIIVAIALGAYLVKRTKDKNKQWTHTLKVRRVLGVAKTLPDGRVLYTLSDPIIHKMRRFPVIKKAEVFELEKPLLGGYLLPELDEYSGLNEFSIILDKNNRIYTNKGEFFDPDKSSVYVSAKHSEIDIERSSLRSKYQDINKVSKRIEWSTIAKYAMMSIAIIAITIVAIVGFQKWGEAQEFKAMSDQAEATAWQSMAEVMDKVQSNTNANILLTEKLKNLYGTNNIQGAIREASTT